MLCLVRVVGGAAAAELANVLGLDSPGYLSRV